MIFGIALNAQCPQDPNLVFTTQEELDQFAIDYPNCNKINGKVEIFDTQVNNLLALTQVDTILNDLVIRKNPNLKTLEGLQNVNFVGGKLHVISCDSLEHIQHLSNVDTIGWALFIVDNASIIDLQGLESIEHLNQELLVNQNENLESLEGLHNLISTGRDVNVQLNPKLSNLNGLRSLRYIYDGISQFECESVTSLAGLDSLEQVSSLWIESTPIFNLEGLGNLSTINGLSFLINGCNSLESLEGLHSLTEINADFGIFFTPFLDNVDALDKITFIEGDVKFGSNLTLENLDGLHSVTQINGEIQIAICPNLHSLHGLRNIDTSGITEITIIENPELNFCSVKSICDFLESDKPRDIRDNLTDCNTEEEITILCETVSNDNIDFNDFSIYPNPTSSTVYFSGTDNFTISSASIYNALGALVKQEKIFYDQIDVADLQNGLYTLALNVNGQMVSRKFVKME